MVRSVLLFFVILAVVGFVLYRVIHQPLSATVRGTGRVLRVVGFGLATLLISLLVLWFALNIESIL